MTNRLTHRVAATALTSLALATACAGADADAPERRDDAATTPASIESNGSSSTPSD